MTYKSFRTVRVITAFFLAMIMSQAITTENYFLAVIAVVAGMAVIFVAKSKVGEVLADERDFVISGKAARMAMSIFAITGAIVSFVYMSMRTVKPAYGIIGSVVAYSVCGLLLLYSALFAYYGKQN